MCLELNWETGKSLKQFYSSARTTGVSCCLFVAVIFVTIGVAKPFCSLNVNATLDSVSVYDKKDFFVMSIMELVSDFWPSNYPNGVSKTTDEVTWGRTLSALCIVFSVCWPYIKVIWLLFLWFSPFKNESTREFQLFCLLWTGRWNLFELFLYNTLAISMTLDNAVFDVAPLITLVLDMRMTAKGYFLFFVLGQLMLLAITEFIYQCSLDFMSHKIQSEMGTRIMDGDNFERKSLISDYSNCFQAMRNGFIALIALSILVGIPYSVFYLDAFSSELIGAIPKYTHSQYEKQSYTIFSSINKSQDRYVNESFAVLFVFLDSCLEVYIPILSVILFLIIWFYPMHPGPRKSIAKVTRICLACCCMDVSAVCRWIVISKLDIFFNTMREVAMPDVDYVCDVLHFFDRKDACISFEGETKFGLIMHTFCCFGLLCVSTIGMRHPRLFEDLWQSDPEYINSNERTAWGGGQLILNSSPAA